MEQESKKSQTIFVVEDDSFLRSLLVRKLESSGYQTEIAINADKAFDKIKKSSPSVVLLDLVLPSGSGYDILKKIKEDPQLKDTPVIILSNLGQKEEVAKGLELGAEDYMVKAHFTPEEIISRIEKLVSK